MRLVLISDTHGLHEGLNVPYGDILIHAGDCTNDIGQASLRNFLKWFESQKAPNKILIAGNRDGAFEQWNLSAREMVLELAPSVSYLEDASCAIDGVWIHGSPVTPSFGNWHFNRDRGHQIKRHWEMIPSNVDILVTHGPARYPNSKLDVSGFDNEHVGCDDLFDAVKRVKPKLHVFGHIHHGYGTGEFIHEDGSKTILVNASICNERYNPVNKPWIIEI